MNLIDLVNAHIDDSARPADTKALLDILDRALRSNDNGCELARTVLQTISRTTRHLDAPHWDALVKTLAECHIVTVARLEAERDAALTARNELECRNVELINRYEQLCHDAEDEVRSHRKTVDRANDLERERDRIWKDLRAELLDERRRHAETAASLSQAEVRVEELSAEIAAKRAAKVAAREQRDRAEVACTCIDGETLDDLLASGPVIMPPCPVHHGSAR